MILKDRCDIIFVLSFIFCYATSEPVHLICERVENVTSTSTIANVGPPGEQGIIGIRGKKGLRGRPAVVDNGRIHQMIDTKIAKAFDDLRDYVIELTRQARGNGSNDREFITQLFSQDGANEPTTSTDQDGTDSVCPDGLRYEQTCYFAPRFAAPFTVTYRMARTECKKHRGLLAEIHNRNQQRAIQDYIRRRLPGKLVDIWIGMQYNKRTSTLLYRSGKQNRPSQLRWYNSYFPSRLNGKRKRMALHVTRDENDERQGLWNEWDRVTQQGMLCEKSI